MKNKKITRKITQGMYVLTTSGGGCVVDAVSQISAGGNPLVAVAVMKSNYTNELLHTNDTFALSVLGMDIDGDIIKTFGLNSMRDIDKFENIPTNEVMGVKVIDSSLGYMVFQKEDTIENDTHTLFIGKMVEGDVYKDGEAMSYGYYQEHKDELVKVKTEKGKVAWVCKVCGYVHYSDELEPDFKCPMCGVGREMFERKTID